METSHVSQTEERSRRWGKFLKTDQAAQITAKYKHAAKQLAELAFEFHRQEEANGFVESVASSKLSGKGREEIVRMRYLQRPL